MREILEAKLTNGQTIQYVKKEDPPRGGMKYTYFTPDKAYVVQFFNDPKVGQDPEIHKRIEAIIGKYNPTLPEEEGGARGNSRPIAQYFAGKYCWPVAIVESPEFGIVCPAYPGNFFFGEGASSVLELKGKDKKSNWFTSRNRKYLEEAELGNFQHMLELSISLARAIRRMHQAGLAHSDLSNNNVLIDPKSGSSIVIDIDSLVVPGLFPPEVVGTRGYIAPEVLTTMELPFGDPRRELPNVHTDLHALAVLIYEYLLMRHPLIGPKIYSKESSEEDDFLALGPRATFIEHPTDQSNRPQDLHVTTKDLGPYLEELFRQAFVDGLHHPNERPTALDWEKGLVKTWDLLHPCSNPDCTAGWFVLHDPKQTVCPISGTTLRTDDVVCLHMKSAWRGRQGQWVDSGMVVVYDRMPLMKWHILSNVFPDEKAERSLQAYVCKSEGRWFLVNHAVHGMMSPRGSLVPVRGAVALTDGAVFRASEEERGFLVEVSVGH